MHVPTTVLFTSLLTLFSTTVSAAPSSCIVPQIAFSTITKPFTLTAIAPKSTWFVLLPTPTATKETQPYISHKKIAPSVFRLNNGTLTTTGADGKTYPAHFGPTIEIFPPVLQPILFGGDEEALTGFFAGYACDSQGKTYVQLRFSEPLVVSNATEGQKIFGQPREFQGTDVVLSFKINEQ